MAAASNAVSRHGRRASRARGSARLFARRALTFALWVALGFGLGMARRS